MRRSLRSALILQLLLALAAILAPAASAQPASGPHETVDQRFTTTRPGSPTGVGYDGSYHAAGDPAAPPPYMRRMVFYPPRGMKYDTGAPARCTATDAELSVRGPDACPAASRIGGGTAEGLFQAPFAHEILIDHYKHNLHVLNNAHEQILLIESEGFTVVRAQIRPDGSIDFRPPSCFPAPPVGPCADDYIVQLKSSTLIPAYTRKSGRRTRSYATTPPKCPARGYWTTRIRFWWSDGTRDSVASTEPCRR